MKETNRLRKNLENIALAFALVLSSGCDSYVAGVAKREEQKIKQEQEYQRLILQGAPRDESLIFEVNVSPHAYVLDNKEISIEDKRFYLKIQREMIDKYDRELSK